MADIILLHRPDAIRRGRALFCSPFPLFVLHAHWLADDDVMGCIATAINDGYGDPNDLDTDDDAQTTQLETALLEKEPPFAISELMIIDYVWPRGRQVALCHASYGDASDALLLYDADDVPAFQVVAAGSLRDLLEYTREEPGVLLPLLPHDDAEVDRVVVRKALPWARYDLRQVVRALTGTMICDAQICRADLLISDEGDT